MDVKTLLLLSDAAIVLLALVIKVFSTPLKLMSKVVLNTLLGLGGLALLNAAAPLTGLRLGLNLFNALVVGIFGVPGIGLLLLVQWVFT